MTPAGQTLCLCMIVKNEAPVIRRCLDSVRPVIDQWVIVDTGSTDGTQDLIRTAMAGMPGELVERPWIDFAHNRSEALALARPRAAYSMVIDADDELVLAPGFRLPDLDADAYTVDIADTMMHYRRAQVFRNALPWRYVGVLHEFPSCEGAGASQHLPLVMRRNHDGRRRRDPETYRKDAAVLERALSSERDPFLISRYTFYLAQSWRDCGEKEKALAAYLARAELGFWTEEIYVALLQAGRLKEALERHGDDVVATYARAAHIVPTRAEALHAASRYCRSKDRFEDGYWWAKRGLGLPLPADGLFVEGWTYDYGLLDELAVHAYWTGRYEECVAVCDALLASGRVPNDMRPRVEANRRFAVDKTTTAPTPMPWTPSRAMGGTELMVEGLRQRLGQRLDDVNLCVNLYDAAASDSRPLVLWIHHDIDQAAVQWLRDKAAADRVDWFVFVSDWQRQRYVATFGLRAERCVVLRNATATEAANRVWAAGGPRRIAYTSTPVRGLSVLLDAWERLRPADAELNIWSSQRLYGPGHDDTAVAHLFERARALPNVIYHGIVPNAELRRALRDIHILAYPSIFQETSCLAAIEAMAAGCRILCPDLGALPETVGPFGNIYPFLPNAAEHAARFADVLAAEIRNPWDGDPGRAAQQQDHARATYDWSVRQAEWEAFIDRVLAARPGPAPIPQRAEPPPRDRMVDCLARLRDKGFRPRGIVDAGAYDGEFSRKARALFADAHILMVDALSEKAAGLAALCAALGNASSLTALLGDEQHPAMSFFVADTLARPDLVKTGSSKFRENSGFPMDERVVPQRRLDNILAERSCVCDLVKLDVQGAELDVLRGLGSALGTVEVVVMEMSLAQYNKGAPLVATVMAELDAMGFRLFEIVDEHRYRDGSLLQIDGIFLRASSAYLPRGPFWM